MDLEIAYSTPELRVDRPLILAADDDEDNLSLLVHALEIFGFSQISTLKGQSVLSLARRYKPDLILLDVIFPDISGLEVIEQLKQHPETRCIPIIAVTALAKAEDRERLLRLGCRDYIDKPYDLDELELMLHQHLSPLPSAS